MYKKLLQLIEFVENENSKCKYDTNKISKRIILKDILNGSYLEIKPLKPVDVKI